jgi:hypothetical protein
MIQVMVREKVEGGRTERQMKWYALGGVGGKYDITNT